MKRSLLIPFALSLLLSSLTLFSLLTSSRTDLRRLFTNPTPAAAAARTTAYSGNLTAAILRLAGSDPGEDALKKDIEDLLEGSLPATSDHVRTRTRRMRATWRWDPHDGDHTHHRLRSPKDYRRQIRILPDLRLLLRLRLRRSHRLYDLSDLRKLPLYPHSSHEGKKHHTCAVVGNSGILLNSNYGNQIDGHDLVIRLNNARTEGYTGQVGSKTGLSFINSHILRQCARHAGCFCHPYGQDVPILMYMCQARHFIDYLTCNSSSSSASSSSSSGAPIVITDPSFDSLCAKIVKYYSIKIFVEETGKLPEDWAKFRDEKLFHYSSGFQAVMVALGVCQRVSIFGFGKSREAKHHYHTDQKKELDLHDYEAEYSIYRDLAERPQVIPFLSDSGFVIPPFSIYH